MGHEGLGSRGGDDSSRVPFPSFPEVWAGAECTVNRVGDRYFDQIARTGHADRLDDLDRLAALGVRAVRYPVLWERIAPEGPGRADWRWADERLGRLREVGVRPILGLVHHGSGPRDTSLLDPAFADRLADYARAVAERYPWVEDYTPVNEPLTTARFSALYGLWYPHARDPLSFATALLTQCTAVARAMAAIREVTPHARLVQTEDLGKTYATPRLQYQADFENERRWLTVDLLCGRVVRGHPMWYYLRSLGVPERALAAFADAPCAPDVVGVNHYLTSERFLDERLDRYPPHTRGGNGRDAYADVEAVRVCAEGVAGPEALLREAWERFGLPLAVTECQLGCTREQQLRWLHEVWSAARGLRGEGVDVRAVTAWSVFGAIDWGCLMTREEGCYESGVFDLRAPRPRPTALARMLRSLATTGTYDHPALDGPGWWEEDRRLAYPVVERGTRDEGRASSRRQSRPEAGDPRPLLITGGRGRLASTFARVCDERGLAYRLVTRGELDVAEPAAIAAAIARHRPWAIVNVAGYSRVDEAERERERCFRANTRGPAVLAELCAERGLALLTVSSDLVFDGAQEAPYTESSPVRPLSVYGASKAEAERRVLAALPSALVVRPGVCFDPWEEHSFVAHALAALAAGVPFAAADDEVVSATYAPDLAHAALDLLIDGECGVVHLANDGALTWAELARRAGELAGLDSGLVDARPAADFHYVAARPRQRALDSERARLMPSVENAICRYLHVRAPEVRQSHAPLAREQDPSTGERDAVGADAGAP
jgi:dTDP-4-dehydrorhamnose reductase